MKSPQMQEHEVIMKFTDDGLDDNQVRYFSYKEAYQSYQEREVENRVFADIAAIRKWCMQADIGQDVNESEVLYSKTEHGKIEIDPEDNGAVLIDRMFEITVQVTIDEDCYAAQIIDFKFKFC